MDKDKTPSSSVPTAPPGDSGVTGDTGSEAPAPGAAKSSAAESSAKQPGIPPKRPRSVGVWVLLVVIIILGVALYGLWPRYGDRLMAVYSGNAGTGVASPPPTEAVVTPALPAQAPATDPPAQASDASLADALAAETAAREGLARALEGQIAELHLRLNSVQERVRQLSSTSREDWLLAEAEYLLRLASQRILTERQAANAAALLESADTILRDFDDPALFPVRKALADDLTRLRMAEPVDRDGIYLRIGALVDSVDQLQSLLPEAADRGASAAEAPSAPLSWHQRLLSNAREALVRMVGLVRIERRDLPVQPMLTLEQEQALRYNLRVVLEQARLALLREEQTIYRASLDRALEWVEAHFAADAVAEVFRGELEALRGQSVVRELPSLDGSLRALRDYSRLWHNRHDEPEAGPRPQAPDAAGEDGAAEEASNPGVDNP